MSDSEEAYLINTRQRRSNAGNRLKHLLELEERQQEEIAQSFATEDDENINLLFQEDDQDEEYSEEESSDAESGGDGDGDGDAEGDSDTENAPTRKRQRDADDSDSDGDAREQVDADDVFTDSDDDSEPSDEEEGEKELQKREKQAKRAKQKKSQASIIPKIKKPSTAPKPKSKGLIVDPSSLLDTNRRSSSRKAVVENKMATVEKLKQAEERRKANRPKERTERHVMTQEERLAEAVETEKANTLSLNRFKEQEVVKKEKQRALAAARKKKLTNIVRFFSYPHYVTPLEEIEIEAKYQEWLESRKERRGRRRRPEPKKAKVSSSNDKVSVPVADKTEDQIVETAGGDDLITEVKSEAGSEDRSETDAALKDENDVAAEAAADQTATTAESAPQVEEEDEDATEAGAESAPQADEEDEDATEASAPQNDEEEHKEPTDDGPAVDVDVVKAEESDDGPQTADAKSEPETDSKINSEEPKDADEMDVDGEDSAVKETVKEDPESEDVVTADADVKKVKFSSQEHVVVIPDSNESPLPTAVVNDVKEEDELKSENDAEEAEAEDKDEAEDETPAIEGPEQLVARNLVLFEEFAEPPSQASIKEILLGDQALLPAARRSNNVEHVLKIRAGTGDDNLEKNLFKSYKDLHRAAFKEFYNLPKFGDDLSAVNQFDQNEEEEAVAEIVIKTPAPVGIYLPNGTKKKCLITGKESQYFDPKNGLPYGSVEAYKVLQQVQNGEFTWCQFSASGGAYFNDSRQVAAKGCPEGF